MNEAAVVKDGQGFTLEGGAMVLADNGLALALEITHELTIIDQINNY